MNKTARTLCMACVFFYAAALGACSDEKTISTPQGKVTVKETSKGVMIKNKDGSMSMEGDDKTGHIKVKDQNGKSIEMTYASDKLVEGFPQDVPIFAPAAVKMSQVMSGQHAVATLSSKTGPDAVHAFYKSAMPQKGWSIENEMTINGMIMLQGKKAETSLTIQIAKQGDETTITIARAGEEK